MKRAGAAFTLGLALCLVAGALAATPLYVPGVGLLLMTVAAGAWVSLAVRGAGVVRTLERPFVSEDFPLRVSVRTIRSRVPIPGAELRPWAGGPPLPVPCRDGHRATTTIRLPRRGRHRLDPASLEIGDPLGLCRRTVASAADEVLVLPRLEPVELTELRGGAGAPGGAGAGEPAGGGTDVDSLQPYRPGTPASRIHWPTVARSGTLIERRLVAEADRLPLIVVDPREPASPATLDQAVRAAASLCVHLGRHGGCALLLPGDRRPARIDSELHGFPEVHARLALLGPDAGGPPPGGLIDGGAVLWVSAATVPARLPETAWYLVSPHPQPRWPVSFTVAGCRGYRLQHSRAGGMAG